MLRTRGTEKHACVVRWRCCAESRPPPVLPRHGRLVVRFDPTRRRLHCEQQHAAPRRSMEKRQPEAPPTGIAIFLARRGLSRTPLGSSFDSLIIPPCASRISVDLRRARGETRPDCPPKCSHVLLPPPAPPCSATPSCEHERTSGDVRMGSRSAFFACTRRGWDSPSSSERPFSRPCMSSG